MANRSTSFVSLLAAVVVAVTGLIPVIWLLSSPAETTVVIEPIPKLEVADLDPAIVRVLQANGYAELQGEAGLEAELPDAVTRVLIDHGAVLTVVEDDPTSEEGG